MYNVLFHIILLAYLLASLLFWLAMGLQQRWLFRLASGLLGGGFGLQTAVLGYRLSRQMFLWWGDVATSLELLSWAIIAVYLAVIWRYRIEALAAFVVPPAFLGAAGAGMPRPAPARFALAAQHVCLGLRVVLALLVYAALTLRFCTA